MVQSTVFVLSYLTVTIISILMSFHVHASGKCTYTQSVAVHQLWHNTTLTCEIISETKGTDWTTVFTEEHSNDCGKCPAHPTES